MNKVKKILCLLVTICAVGIYAGNVNFLGKNIFDDIKLSSWDKNGHGTVKTVPNLFFGNSAFLLNNTKSKQHVSVTSPLIPVKDGYYLFSLVYKTKNFGLKGYSGVGAYPKILWYDKHKRFLPAHKENLWRFSYYDVDWTFNDGLLRTPEGGGYIRLQLNMFNSSPVKGGKTLDPQLWISSFQLRQYTPPPTPKEALGKAALMVDGGIDANPFKSYYFARQDMRGGNAFSKIIMDKDAERGSALLLPAVGKKGIGGHSNYEHDWEFGLYRLQTRVKRTPGNQKLKIGSMDVLSEHDAGRVTLELTTENVNPPNQYVVLERDFIVRGPGFNAIRIFSEGKLPWTADWCRIIPLKNLADQEFESIYPGMTGIVPKTLMPKKNYDLKTLAFCGMGYEKWRYLEAARLSSMRTDVSTVWARGDSPYFVNLPKDPADIFKYDVIALLNIDISKLSMKWRKYIYEYVKRGGILFVTGGNMSYERCSWAGSTMEPLLPFKVADSIKGGFIYEKEGMRVGNENTDLGYVTFLHRVELKPEAKLVLDAESYPFAVTMNYGKGKVFFISAWANGTIEDDPARKMFFNTPKWKYFIRGWIQKLWRNI